MDEHRTFLRITNIFQDRQQVIEIMPVDGTDIIKAQFFKHRTAGKEGTREFFRFTGFVLQKFR